MTRADQIAAERVRNEALASERAAGLQPGLDLHASNSDVCRWNGSTSEVVVSCESHWQACLVLLAYGKSERPSAPERMAA